MWRVNFVRAFKEPWILKEGSRPKQTVINLSQFHLFDLPSLLHHLLPFSWPPSCRRLTYNFLSPFLVHHSSFSSPPFIPCCVPSRCHTYDAPAQWSMYCMPSRYHTYDVPAQWSMCCMSSRCHMTFPGHWSTCCVPTRWNTYDIPWAMKYVLCAFSLPYIWRPVDNEVRVVCLLAAIRMTSCGQWSRCCVSSRCHTYDVPWTMKYVSCAFSLPCIWRPLDNEVCVVCLLAAKHTTSLDNEVCVYELAAIHMAYLVIYVCVFTLDGTLCIIKYVLHLCAQYVERVHAVWYRPLLWGAVE